MMKLFYIFRDSGAGKFIGKQVLRHRSSGENVC